MQAPRAESVIDINSIKSGVRFNTGIGHQACGALSTGSFTGDQNVAIGLYAGNYKLWKH